MLEELVIEAITFRVNTRGQRQAAGSSKLRAGRMAPRRFRRLQSACNLADQSMSSPVRGSIVPRSVRDIEKYAGAIPTFSVRRARIGSLPRGDADAIYLVISPILDTVASVNLRKLLRSGRIGGNKPLLASAASAVRLPTS